MKKDECPTDSQSHDFNVYPVQHDEDKLGENCDKPIIPNLVHFNIFLGKIRSGKTVLLQNLYLSERFYGKDFDIKILISPSAHNDTMLQHMVKHFTFVFDSYSEDLLQEILHMIEQDETDARYLLVMDDIMGDRGFEMKKTGKQDLFSSMVTKFRHIGCSNTGTEGKLSIALTVQRYKFLTQTLRQNAQGLFIMGSFPEAELKKIAEDYSFIGGSEKQFLDIFTRSRKEPWDFLYINVPKLEAWRSFKEKLYEPEF